MWPDSVPALSKLTDGVVGSKTFSFLPQVTPRICLVLALLVQLPSVARLIRQPSGLVFHQSLLVSGFAAFLFGWHVHEKASLPLLVLAFLLKPSGISEAGFQWLYWAAGLSLVPLTKTVLDRLIALLLIVAWSFVGASESFQPSSALRLYLSLGILIQLAAIASLVDPPSVFGKYEFLPLLLTSIHSSLGMVFTFIKIQVDSSFKAKLK